MGGIPYQFGAGRGLVDLLPEEATQAARDVTWVADQIPALLAAGGLAKYGEIGTRWMARAAFRSIIETGDLPRSVFISPDKIRSIFQTGEFISPEEMEIVKGLGLTGPEYRNAAKLGVNVEIQTDRLVEMTDRPWWAKVKALFGVEPTQEFTVYPGKTTYVIGGKSGMREAPAATPEAPAGEKATGETKALTAPAEEALPPPEIGVVATVPPEVTPTEPGVSPPVPAVPPGEPTQAPALFQGKTESGAQAPAPVPVTTIAPEVFTREHYAQALEAHPGFTPEQQADLMAIADAQARVWAENHGATVADFWAGHMAGVQVGGEGGATADALGQPKVLDALSHKIKAFVDGVLAWTSDKPRLEEIRYRFVDAGEAAKIHEKTGLRVEGWRHVIDHDSIIHMMREHGDPAREGKRHQRPITSEDISKIPEIVRPENIVKRDVTRIGKPAIIYRKEYDGALIYVEEVWSGRKKLVAKTLRKEILKTGTRDASLEQGPPHTSETLPDSPKSISGNRTPDKTIARGAVQFAEDGRAILHLFDGADVSTPIHEFFHIAMNDLEGEDLAATEEFLGKPRAEWGTAEKEKFADAGEKYILEGVSPSARLRAVFARMKKWFLEIYRTIRSFDHMKLTPRMRRVFDNILATHDEQADMAFSRMAEAAKNTNTEGRVPAKALREYDALAAEAARRAVERVAKRQARERAKVARNEGDLKQFMNQSANKNRSYTGGNHVND